MQINCPIFLDTGSRRIGNAVCATGFKISLLYGFSYEEDIARQCDGLVRYFELSFAQQQTSAPLVRPECYPQSSSQVCLYCF